ncbi:lamin tail domain-containing protein [Gracilimonas halophila]|uniref:Lamin tail domain-containing protein n=1 Tax=Gracilimonas halophila TaxID=1834464 RepID=A0ABW5JHV0_9BACT
MKKLLLFILLTLPSFALAQTQVLNETFDDGDFTTNPEWTGDTGEFTIFDNAGNDQLRLNDTDASNSSSFLVTPSTTAYGSWEFFIDQDFEPSNSNRGFIFLVSDREDLNDNVNGYAVRAGESGSEDRFRLFQFTNGIATEILTGTLDLSAGGPFQIRVTRDENGNWELFESAGYGSTPASAATATDNTHTTSSYFGIRTNYTSTRSENFYFDDTIITNTEDFSISSASGASSQAIDVTFNYQIDSNTIDPSNFDLSGIGSPQQTEVINSDLTVRLTFADDIPNGDYTLTVNSVENIYGGTIPANSEIEFKFSNTFELIGSSSTQDDHALLEFNEDINFTTVESTDFTINGESIDPATNITQPENDQLLLEFPENLPSGPVEIEVTNIESVNGWNIPDGSVTEFFIYDDYQPGDIIINEFMKDPPTGTAEYVELKNISDRYLNLRNWKIGDNNAFATITGSDFAILPDSFAVISADTSALSTFYGNANYMQASLPAFNNTGSEQVRLRDENDITQDSLEYNSDWGGEDVAIERRSPAVSSTFRENWGDSPSEDLGTPGLSNLITPDITAPELLGIQRPANDQIELSFSERLQEAEAQNPTNFTLTANGLSEDLPALQSATLSSSSSITLQYDAPLSSEPSGTTYELTIANQTDIFGNTAADISSSFFVIEYAVADSGDVFITEFMYNPATGFTDFIEIYNPTDNAFNLQGWTYNDNSGNARTITDSEFALAPNSYIVLVPHSTISGLFPNITLADMGSGFANLNSTTPDDIVIRKQNGTLIDSLTYTPEWGGNEVSLERKSVGAPSIYRENWGNSPSGNLGTPGAPNQIQPDNTPPEIINTSIVAPDSIRITFNERIDSVLAKNTANYSISPSVSISEIAEFSGNTLIVVLGTSLIDGGVYTLTIEDQKDIFDNIQASVSTELQYTEFSPADIGNVIINEILYQRESADSEEFIELYNRTNRNFDLSNWTLSDATGSTAIPEGTELRGGEYLVLTDLQIFADEVQNGVYLSGFPSLNDDEDAVVIKNEDGITIDSLFYSETWGGNEPGVSLERKDPESASNDASNWASNEGSGSSAGVQSSVFEPDETPPQILFSKIQSDGTIFVAFTEFVNIDNASAFVNEQPASIIDYSETDGNIVILENPVSGSAPSSAKAKGNASEPLSLTFTDFTDFRGNANQELGVEISQPINPGTVVINEILYNPLANSDDNLPDQTEYIELFNPSDYAVSLEGFFLHDEPDEDGEVRSLFPVSSQYKWIPAGAHVVVYAEDEAPNFSESQLAEYFELENESDQFKVRIDRSSLSLSNADDAIYLADSTGTTIDSVFYDESWQNPNLFDTDGVALERIDPEGPSDDPSNWSSSTRVNGGTPGEQNSIFQEAGSVSENTGITFTPNPFSPDDDGFEDNLFINYKLDESDYLLRVRIFDRYGREVRELADGLQAGFEGSLIWDGRTDDNRSNRVGIYIVLFEAYNSANGSNVTFKKTVVLARKF